MEGNEFKEDNMELELRRVKMKETLASVRVVERCRHFRVARTTIFDTNLGEVPWPIQCPLNENSGHAGNKKRHLHLYSFTYDRNRGARGGLKKTEKQMDNQANEPET
jgi:hypothetical protein